MSIEEQYMARCLFLAKMAMGKVKSNPLVGAVIVHNDKIIGEGYHQFFGGVHAEVNAVNAVFDRDLLKESTLYVSLEPCSHFGKTPPCSSLIIESGIPEVVIGMSDPNSLVNGKGIKALKDAGIKVRIGVLEDNCKELNKRFVCFHEQHRPYLILKWAQSADAFMGRKGERLQISNAETSLLTHKWRSEEMSILIGADTVINDNPLLDVRLWKGDNPIRVIVDRSGKLVKHPHLKIFDRPENLIIFTSSEMKLKAGINIIHLKDDALFMKSIFHQLHQMGVSSCFVEGGAKIHRLLLDKNLWDEARVFTSPNKLDQGIEAPEISQSIFSREKIKDNELIIYKNTARI